MKNSLLLLIFFVLSCNVVNSQGCSDAGFCTLDNNSPEFNPIDRQSNSFSAGVSYGLADHNITAFSTFLKYKKQVQNHIAIETKLTSISQRGEGISSSGLSDVFLNLSYNHNLNTLFSAGVKIPLSNANKMKDDLKNHNQAIPTPNYSLPLDYQSSLGTFDLLLGMSYRLNDLQINTALQQPLTQSKNGFVYGDGGNNFQTTNGFERRGDILLRFSYYLKLGKKLKFSPSLLNIYHLGKDTYLDNNIRKDIEGSKGLTINATAFFDFKLSDKSNLKFNMGSPLVVRQTRPDGLTRSFIAGLEYSIHF